MGKRSTQVTPTLTRLRRLLGKHGGEASDHTRPLTCELAWSERAALRDALREHPLVRLRAPDMTPGELVELASGLGEIEPPLRVNFRLADEPRVMRFGNGVDADGKKVGANALETGWHLDGSYRTRSPQVTMLLARQVPTRGGDTHFVSLYRLYEQLDAATRAAWEGLQAEHESASAYFDEYHDRLSVHPLIRAHADSGRMLVYACPAYMRRVLGVPETTSRAILARLAAACEPPDHVHRWQPGDLLVWDNQAVMHKATPHAPDERRELWRCQLFLTGRD